MFHHILVPIDFSETSTPAWELACRLASRGSTLHALNVVTPLYPDVAYANLPAAMKEQQDENEHRLTTVATIPPGRAVAVDRMVVVGDAAEVIVAAARETSADLIVIGAHRHHGLDHWLRGSVTDRVVHAAPCDVLVAKTER